MIFFAHFLSDTFFKHKFDIDESMISKTNPVQSGAGSNSNEMVLS